MNASEILRVLSETEEFLGEISRFPTRDPDIDVTDFGLGTFSEVGLVAYVLFNYEEYCSKWLVLQDGQLCPNHHHRLKTEDIACEFGSIELTLYGTTRSMGPQEYGQRDLTVKFCLNNKLKVVNVGDSGMLLHLTPGDIIHILPGVWHDFRAICGPAFAVEVSTTNNDVADNFFQDERIRRFVPKIEPDADGQVVWLDDRGFIRVGPQDDYKG